MGKQVTSGSILHGSGEAGIWLVVRDPAELHVYTVAEFEKEKVIEVALMKRWMMLVSRHNSTDDRGPYINVTMDAAHMCVVDVDY